MARKLPLSSAAALALVLAVTLALPALASPPGPPLALDPTTVDIDDIQTITPISQVQDIIRVMFTWSMIC